MITELHADIIKLFLEAKAIGAVVEVGHSPSHRYAQSPRACPDIATAQANIGVSLTDNASNYVSSSKCSNYNHAGKCASKRSFRVRVCKDIDHLEAYSLGLVSIEKNPDRFEQILVVWVGGKVLREIPLRNIAQQRGFCKGYPVVVLGSSVQLYC